MVFDLLVELQERQSALFGSCKAIEASNSCYTVFGEIFFLAYFLKWRIWFAWTVQRLIEVQEIIYSVSPAAANQPDSRKIGTSIF